MYVHGQVLISTYHEHIGRWVAVENEGAFPIAAEGDEGKACMSMRVKTNAASLHSVFLEYISERVSQFVVAHLADEGCRDAQFADSHRDVSRGSSCTRFKARFFEYWKTTYQRHEVHYKLSEADHPRQLLLLGSIIRCRRQKIVSRIKQGTICGLKSS